MTGPTVFGWNGQGFWGRITQSDALVRADAMDRIIVDESFTNQLPEAQAPCLVFDSSGRRLGCFTPEVDPAWYEDVMPSVSEEELTRRERAGGGRSLSEILADLKRRH
jgi:hypothetical protein